MITENLNKFFKKVSEDTTMRHEFVTFAANHDVDLSELSEAELDDIAGGAGGSIIVVIPPGAVRK